MTSTALTRSHEWRPAVVGRTSATLTASAEHAPSSGAPTTSHSDDAADASATVAYSTSTSA